MSILRHRVLALGLALAAAALIPGRAGSQTAPGSGPRVGPAPIDRKAEKAPRPKKAGTADKSRQVRPAQAFAPERIAVPPPESFAPRREAAAAESPLQDDPRGVEERKDPEP